MARKPSSSDVIRTRKLWAANRPGESAAPAYVPDPPALWVAAVSIALALLIQSTLAPYLSVRGAPFSLVTLVVAWYAVRTGSLAGLTCGLLAGAAEDALAGASGVGWTFATGLAGALAGRLHGTWMADTKLALIPAAAIVTLFRYFAYALVMQAQRAPVPFALAHFHTALWQSALDAVLAALVLTFVPAVAGGRYRL